MPFVSTPSSVATSSKPWFWTALRIARYALAALVVGFCLLLLAIRFVVFPRLEANTDRLAGLLAAEVGRPVELEALHTGWDGWNPRLDIRGLRILDREHGSPLLTLPEVKLVVAWTSLPFVDLRFKELAIERPQLILSRDRDGMLHVAGMMLDPAERSGDTRVADWLLRQPRVVIHDASIQWNDNLRGAPTLVLEHVYLRLENHFGRHRFGLRGVPPAELAAPLDLRGDIAGGTLRDWQTFSGKFYARLDYADIAAWREWLPLPVPLKSGKGALRTWFEFADGAPREIVSDLVLADVQAKLGDDLPELALTHLDGRVGWRQDGSRREFFTKELEFVGPDRIRFDPTDFMLVMRSNKSGATDGGLVEFNRLQLEPLRLVATFLPLPERWRAELARFKPRGTLRQVALQWQGEPAAPTAFTASGQAADLGVDPQDKFPGVAGLTGSFDTTELKGSFKLQSRGLTVQVPTVYADALHFDTAQGLVRWRQEQPQGFAIAIDHVAFANTDMAGNVNGEFRTLPAGPGRVDLTAQLTRAAAQSVYRYIPLQTGAPVREWLRHSLVAGTASEARVRLSGDLVDFPFADGKKGQFIVTVKAQGLTLDYADHWPKLSDVDADLHVEGARLTVDTRRARMFGAVLNRAQVELLDLRVPNPVLRVDGEASGPIDDFLRFVEESPVANWIGHATDGAVGSGSGHLALKLELALGKPEADKVAGEFAFSGNRLKLLGDVPALNQINGKLTFAEHEVRANPLTAEILGGPARVVIASVGDDVHVDAQGSANLSLLKSEYPKEPLAARVSGTTDWQVAMIMRDDRSDWVLDSSLKGATIDLPEPALKKAGDSVPLKVERRAIDAGHDAVTLSYGRVGRLTMQRRLTATQAIPERALLTLGGAEGEADRRGLWIRGDLPALNLDGWLAVKAEADNTANNDLQLAGVDMHVGALDVFGRRLNDLRVGASRNGSDWQLDLRGRELEGNARWEAPMADRPNGRIVARLQRASAAPAAPDAPPADTASIKAESDTARNSWPELDIVSESFLQKGRDLGKLEVLARPQGTDWQIERLKLGNDDGQIEAQGLWRASGRTQQTRLDVKLDVSDAAKYLARFGMPQGVRDAPTKITGQLSWAGSPQDFDYPTLTGNFRVEVGPGQFTKLDPGIGKLLGVLSLQSLRRRLSFDFQDVFGEGFAFDEITGDVQIRNGVMRTDELKILGPAARIVLSGETDISRETQKINVRVQPTLSGSISVGAAALMIANPIIGAVVGAGSLLAQKVFKDPIEQLFSYEYNVSGSWSDPIVEKASSAPATYPAANLTR